MNTEIKNKNKFLNATGTPDKCPCTCKDGSPYYQTGCGGTYNCTTCCMNNENCEGGSIAPNLTSPVITKRTGGIQRTGQPVSWRKQSGTSTSSDGKLLGLTTAQLLIAGAVGVGAYLLIKKKK